MFKELLKKLEAAQLRAKELGAKATLTEEENTEFEKCLTDIDSLREQVEAYETRQKRLEGIDTTVSGIQERAAQPTTKPVDTKPADIHVKEKRSEDIFSNNGEFYSAVMRSAFNKTVDPRLVELRAIQGHSETVPADGGFLIPENMSNEIYESMRSVGGEVLSRVDKLSLSQGNGIKIPAVDESSYASGITAGGIYSYWGSEGESFTKSKAKFREMDLRLNKIHALVYATEEVLADASVLAGFIGQKAPQAINWKVEDAIFNGDGAGKPLGILNSDAVVTVAKTSGQSADTITAANIFNMYSRMMAPNLSNAAWFVNQDVFPQLMGMTQGNYSLWLPGGQVEGAPYGMLLGRPVIPVEYCPTLGEEGDIMFLDLSEYQAIDKGGIQSAVSMHVEFLTDQSVFRFTYRFDGQPKLKSAITPANGTKTISPFVSLAERA